jgi:hypothetical protein
MLRKGKKETNRLFARKSGRDGGQLRDDSIIDDSGRATPNLIDEELNSVSCIRDEGLLAVGPSGSETEEAFVKTHMQTELPRATHA